MEPSEELESAALSHVATLDNKLRKLYENRASILQKINNIQSPMISRVPPEALSRIFWFATRPTGPWYYPRLSDTKVLFDLSAVCSLWRRSIQSSPQLWTALVLQQKKSEEQTLATDYVALARHHFQRLGPRATTMSVYITDLSLLTNATIGEIVQILLEEYPGKLGSLRLSWELGEHVWPHIFKYAKKNVEFTQLRELVLHWSHGKQPPQHIFRSTPRLRTLSLYGGGNWQAALELPWKQITTLKLCRTSLADSLQLLSLCPNLITYKISNHDRGNRLWAPRRHQTFPMQFVRKLTWSTPGDYASYPGLDAVDDAFFTRFLFPAVRKLKWNAQIPSNAAPYVHDFFAGMHEIEVLKFSLLRAGACIDQHIEAFSNLRILKASLVGYSGKDLRRWLCRLTVKPGGNPGTLPRLEQLHLTIGAVTPDELIIVLHSRRSAPVNWCKPKRHYTELVLPPYDPTSTHWQNHSRLLEFSCRYDRDNREQEWEWSPYYDALEDMIREAKEVEGFEWFYDCQCRIRF